MKEFDEKGNKITRKANGEIFRGIDFQLKLGLITPEKYAKHLKRGTNGFVTPAPHPIIEIYRPHNWFD